MIMFATPKEVTCAQNKREAVELALDNPIKAMKVEALAKGKGSCVIITDAVRHLLLRPFHRS